MKNFFIKFVMVWFMLETKRINNQFVTLSNNVIQLDAAICLEPYISKLGHSPPCQYYLYCNSFFIIPLFTTYRQLRARRALITFQRCSGHLRTRRALSQYNVYSDSALLVLNRTSLKSDSAIPALNWQYVINLFIILSCSMWMFYSVYKNLKWFIMYFVLTRSIQYSETSI